jgi:hypothetical protein
MSFTFTTRDLKKEARKTLARQRLVVVDEANPNDLAGQIIDANPLDELISQAKESYRIRVDIPRQTYGAYEDCIAIQCQVKNILRLHYRCVYVCDDDTADTCQFELHYDRSEEDLGSDDDLEYLRDS